MPGRTRREGVTWARPWLELPRELIEAYIRQHRLAYVDDDSNGDARFARNRLRLEAWPALVAAFPAAEASLAAAANWAQEASAALAELAEIDLAAICHEGELDIAAWRQLSPPRQSNLVRAWLRRATGRAPPASLVERLLHEVPLRGAMRWPLGVGQLRSYRGRLRHEPLPGVGTAGPAAAGAATGGSWKIDLSRPGVHDLAGWEGLIEVRPVSAGGIAAPVAARLEVRARRPGDRFQAGAGRPPRSLKLQFQAAGLPAWQRQGPVLCLDEVPVFVAGLGIDARALASAGEPQLALAWLPRR
jgi:tRNA(Ile)-lysidine synthase